MSIVIFVFAFCNEKKKRYEFDFDTFIEFLFENTTFIKVTDK